MEHRAGSFPLRVVALDVVLALFITVMQVQGTLAKVAAEGAPRALTDFGNLGYALLIVSGLVVAVRHQWPVPVFLTAALASLVYYGLDFPDGPGWLGLFVALYTLTAYGDGRRSLVIAGVGIAVLAIVWLWLFAAADIKPGSGALGWVFFRIGASVMSAALGESVRSRRVIAAEAQERAERAEQTREEEARARVDAERLRIAREGPRHRRARHSDHQRPVRGHRARAGQATRTGTRSLAGHRADQCPGAARDASHPRG